MFPSDLWKKFKSYLITGALVMVPLFISFFLVVVLIRFVARHAGLGHGLASDVLGIVLVLILFLVVGALTQHAIGTRFMNWLTLIMSRIPIAGTIYSATKQIMEAIMLKKSMAFRKAVIIEYPRKGIYSVAFITREPHASMHIPTENSMVHVFLPTTPNPTSGFMLIMPEKDTIPLDISVEDAFKLIISGGIISYDANKSKSGGTVHE